MRKELLVYHPVDLLVRRWSYNSGMITVVHELGLNSSKIWQCSTTILAEEEDGSRCSRRVDDAKVKKELMGCQLWALVVTMPWIAWIASMASVVWMAQGGTDVEAPLVPMMVATNGGFDGWRRWLASNGGVDGWCRWLASMVGVDGGLGSSTQRALTWKSLCVPSCEGDTHSCSFALRLNSLQVTSVFFFGPVSRSRFVTVCCVSCSTVWPHACVSFFTVFVQFHHDSVYYDSYSHSRAVLPFDVTPSEALHSASKRKSEREVRER